MRDQVEALIWLRFVLLSHTFTKAKRFSFAVVVAFLVIVTLGAAGLGLVFFTLSASFKPNEGMPIFVLCGAATGFFCFFWLFSLFMELQRSEAIDFRKMLHLPISLRMVFLLNFAAALFTPSVILFLFSTVGLVAGLCVSQGSRMLLAIPLAAAFYLMLAAWTYYVRGILAILMENKRRRRLIVTLISVAFVLIGQLPNIINHAVFLPRTRHMIETTQKTPQNAEEARRQLDAMRSAQEQMGLHATAVAHTMAAAIPVGWLPLGVSQLAEGRWLGFSMCLAGLLVLMAAGLGLGFRSTWRYYVGAPRKRRIAEKPIEPAGEKARKKRWIEWSLPFVDDDTSAMVMACLLTYLRQPNIYMMLIMPILFGVIFLFMFTGGVTVPNRFQGPIAPIVATIWPLFNFGFILLNLFGIDRDGFRTLILLPTERRKYLLGKNLALMPLVVGISSVFIVLMVIMARPRPAYVIIALIEVVQLFLMYCMVGNFASLVFPYRTAWEGLRNTGNRSMMLVTNLLSLLLVLVLSLPAALLLSLDSLLNFLCGYNGISIGVPAALFFLGVTVLIYRRLLSKAGALLLRSEQHVLDKLARDRE